MHLLKRRGYEVVFCWVPAHVGIEGNERADEAAKAAGTEAAVPRSLPHRDFHPLVKSAMWTCWQYRWNNTPLPNKLREVTNVVHPWEYVSMPRRWETALVRLWIGHTRLTHGHLMDKSAQPMCDKCPTPLTVKHILVDCPGLRALRSRFLHKHRLEDGSYSLASILGSNVSYPQDGIFKYIEALGILHSL